MTQAETEVRVARFQIGDRTYTTASLDEMTLKDLLDFEGSPVAQALGVKFSDIEQLSREMADLSEAETESHPQALLLVGITVWASRRAAGDVVSFDEALDVRLKDLTFLPSVEDRRPPTKPSGGKKKAAKKAPASVAAGSAPDAG